jgi:hypothetical protein
MLDEAPEPEQALRRRITKWLTDRCMRQARTAIEGIAEANNGEVRSYGDIDVHLTTQDFDTLIVQFRALGLIQKSQRNRSVKDTATYWSLTPYGDEHLTTLKAIRRETSGNGAGVLGSVTP